MKTAERMKLSQELIGILAVGVALAGLQLTMFATLRGDMNVLREDVRHDIDAIRLDIQDIRADVRDIRADVRQLRDRLPAAGA